MSETDFKVATDQEAKLSETITHSAIRKKGKALDVQPVVVVNPDTGELQGFLPPSLQAGIRRQTITVQNQWYDFWTGLACAAGQGTHMHSVRIYYLSLEQATANENLEVRIIADNYDATLTIAPAVAGTNYEIAKWDSPDDAAFLAIQTTFYAQSYAYLLEARMVQIMYRKTTAAGANNTTLKCLFARY